MQPLGIPAGNMPDYERAVRATKLRRTVIDVLDLDYNHLSTLTAQASWGQVLCDRHGNAQRALRLVIDDPTQSIDFDPDSPSPSAVYFTQQLQVSVPVYVPELAADVTASLITGPITAFMRDERLVYLEAQSTDTLARVPAWQPVTLLRGMPKDEAIAALLDDAGETRYIIPTLSEPLRRTVSVPRFGDRYEVAQKIARSMDLDLSPRGDGYHVVRELPTNPLWNFSTADGTDDPSLVDVVGRPRVRRSTHMLTNAVEVLGPPARAGQERIRGVAVASAAEQSSPDAFIRGGQRGYRPIQRVYNQAASNAQAQAIAERMLNERLVSGATPRFTARPIYHFDTADMADLATSDATIPFRLDKFAVPVGTKGGGVMSVGFHLKTTPDEAWA